jgi:flavin-binding protein dodecin
MAGIYKKIEIVGTSPDSFAAAVKSAVAEAAPAPPLPGTPTV